MNFSLRILVSFSTLFLSAYASGATEYVCGVTDRTYIFDTFGPTKASAGALAKRFCIRYGRRPSKCDQPYCKKITVDKDSGPSSGLIYIKEIATGEVYQSPSDLRYRSRRRGHTGGGYGSGHSDSRTSSSRDTSPRLCPDGKYHGGGCQLCPDGKYHGGDSCQLGPDGNYHGGQPTLCPDGKYHSGTCTLCPDGEYHGGSCQLGPDGKYHGDGD